LKYIKGGLNYILIFCITNVNTFFAKFTIKDMPFVKTTRVLNARWQTNSMQLKS